MLRIVVALIVALAGSPATATNTPCSGAKGGIAHCRGNLFVCQDGSTSGSKKDCRTYDGGMHNTDKSDPHPSEAQPPEKAKTK